MIPDPPAASEPWLCALADARDPRRAGGKASSLARMAALGVTVPKGFVVACGAFDAFLSQGGLRARIAALRAGLRADDAAAVAEAATRIQALVRETPLPPELPARLWETRQRLLSDTPLAVRSSAIGEDSAEASFAGQLDSVLGVRTRAELERALLDCWASYYNPRALSYQLSRGVSLAGMGVVVQELVQARLAGVLFTRAPGPGGDGELVVEYCHGLGDALVSGRINPGQLRIDREGLAWRRVRAPEQEGAPGDDAGLLHDAQIEALAREALSLEAHFGAPQDVEWAIDGAGKLHFVQSRPITWGPRGHAASAAASPGPLVHWSNANVNENFPDPITPFLYSFARAGYHHYFRNVLTAAGVPPRRLTRMDAPLRNLIGVHGARMYYNLSNLAAVLRVAPYGDLLVDAFNQFVGAEDPDRTPHPRRAVALHPGQLAEVARIAVTLGWKMATLGRRVRRFERTVDAFAAATHPARLPAKRLCELHADLGAFLDIRFHRWTDASLADAAAMVSYGLLKVLLRQAFPDEAEGALHNTLLKGLSNLVSSKPVEALWDLAQLVRGDAALREAFATNGAPELLQLLRGGSFPRFREALDAWLEAWGFRGSGELMLTAPSYQERPEALLDLVKSYLATDGDSPAELIRARGAERVAQTREVIARMGRARALRHLPLLRRAHVARLLLRWTHSSVGFRERARLKQALLYARLRRIVLSIGERLVERGTLARADDAFFLTWPELDELLAGGAMFPHVLARLVAERRREHERLSRMRPPDAFSLPLGEYLPTEAPAAPRPAAEEEGGRLQGMGTCGGRVSARAVVVRDLSEAHLIQTGDILVTRQTDPGWAPVFFLVKGLVIERGGMLSHGAIISREFGIPAVVGVPDATRRIAQGQTITVDGDRGHVLLG